MYYLKPGKTIHTQHLDLNEETGFQNNFDTSDKAVISRQTISQSIFKNNNTGYIKQQKLDSNHSNFVFGLVLFALVIFAWIRFNYLKRLKEIFNAFTGRNFANQFIREGNFIKEALYLPLMVFSLLSYSLMLIYSGINLLDYKVNDFPALFLFVFTGVIGYWLIKTTIIHMLGYIFRTTASSYEYILNMHVYFIIGSMGVFPFTIFSIYFMPEIFSFFSLIILSIIFILWLIRALRIGLDEKHFSKFHLFLYLCTLEFLPLVLLAKIILNNT